MKSQMLLTILLVLTVLVEDVWSQLFFGTIPPRSISDINVFYNKISILVGLVRLFLGEKNIAIANFSMIAARQFHDTDQDSPGSDNADGQNDGLWCQSSLNESMIGTWYYPNGSTVPCVESVPLYSNNTPTSQIGLLRRGGIASIQGLYKCVIPNEEGVNQTLYVAAYGNNDFDKDDGKIIICSCTLFLFSCKDPPIIENFSLQFLSSVDADPSVFSLSFNVTNRPPTNVTCSINGSQLNIFNNDLMRTVIKGEDPVTVQVTILFRLRVTGLYQCSVTTDRITSTPLSANTLNRNIFGIKDKIKHYFYCSLSLNSNWITSKPDIQ